MGFQFEPDSWFLQMSPFGGDVETSSDTTGQPIGQPSPPAASPVATIPTTSTPPTQSTTHDDGDDDDEYVGYSAKELRRLLRDTSASKSEAERARDTYKTKVDEQERKTRTEAENLQTDLKAALDRNAALVATNAKLAIVTGIICDTRYSWHNPEIVAQQLNPAIVKVGDDGKVEGLKKELDRVAKDHAYLLKTSVQQPPSSGPTGFQPVQGGANPSGNGTDIKELAKTYPALASRM